MNFDWNELEECTVWDGIAEKFQTGSIVEMFGKRYMITDMRKPAEGKDRTTVGLLPLRKAPGRKAKSEDKKPPTT